MQRTRALSGTAMHRARPRRSPTGDRADAGDGREPAAGVIGAVPAMICASSRSTSLANDRS